MEETRVVLEDGTGMREIRVRQGESLMQAMRRAGCPGNAVCGGNGRCGKCGVRISEGDAAVSARDSQFFRKEELKAGWRLACTLFPTEDLRLSRGQAADPSFEILAEFCENAEEERRVGEDGPGPEGEAGAFCIAVDIGTTTLALALLKEGETAADDGISPPERPLCVVTLLNSQRSYGADVIARIQHSAAGQKRALQACIQKDLRQGLGQLAEEYGIPLDAVRRIAVCANTTMLHLLLGYDCGSLGVYPFTPVNIGPVHGDGRILAGEEAHTDGKMAAEGEEGCGNGVPVKTAGSGERGRKKSLISWEKIRVELLPGISAFVGADIVAGMSACGFPESEEICLLVDLGTNGEMALGNRKRILAASTAAGPAFEGGNIAWGTGSVRGAVCSVAIEEGRAAVRTIQDAPPVGICGTGVVETVAELLRNGLVDETGLLADAYFEEGFPLAETAEGKRILFTQKDVREIQLAKAAVRAGIETLLARYGIDAGQVTRICLAGGFGYRLDWRKAMAIGMFPDGFSGRIQAVGNAALAGTAGYLQIPDEEMRILALPGICEEVPLAADAGFNELYLRYMTF